jgi:hypothetical protein
MAYRGPTMQYACFACRKCFKRPMAVAPINRFMTSEQQTAAIRMTCSRDEATERKCPDCGGVTFRMGIDFKTPRNSDARAWAAVEKYIRAGKTYYRGSR